MRWLFGQNILQIQGEPTAVIERKTKTKGNILLKMTAYFLGNMKYRDKLYNLNIFIISCGFAIFRAFKFNYLNLFIIL